MELPNTWVNPQELKKILHNSVDIGKEPGSNQMFPFVAVTVTDAGVQGYGRSHYVVGYSFTSEPLYATDQNTVLIEMDEAKELGMAVGKTSAAKDAQVYIEIEDGRLAVSYGPESIAELASVEPQEGDIESINDEAEILSHAGEARWNFLAIGTEVMKRLTKIRTRTPYLDIGFTSIGNTALVRAGEHFIGGFEAIDRGSVQEPQLFTE